MPHPTPVSILVLLAVGIGALLAAEGRGSRAGTWVAKPLAAAAYLWLALDAGAAATGYGRAVLVALGLCWWGDVLLIPRERPRVFRAGVLAFLAGHVAYAAAFAVRGIDLAGLGLALVVMAVPALAVRRWLAGRVPEGLRGAVAAYIGVISVMFAMALATHRADQDWAIVAGAGLFWVSDLFVARDRFVARGFVNRLIGLPLYFGAQALLALSVAG